MAVVSKTDISKKIPKYFKFVSKMDDQFRALRIYEPEFHYDLVYTFKKIMGRTVFSDQFRKMILHR